MVSARGSPDPVTHWIALLDEAEYLIASAPCAPGGLLVAEPALAALVAYEHTMTPTHRQQAREMVWRRDHPTEPLPVKHPLGGDCSCRACRQARQSPRQPIRPDRREAVYQAQLQALTKQKHRYEQKGQRRTWQER